MVFFSRCTVSTDGLLVDIPSTDLSTSVVSFVDASNSSAGTTEATLGAGSNSPECDEVSPESLGPGAPGVGLGMGLSQLGRYSRLIAL